MLCWHAAGRERVGSPWGATGLRDIELRYCRAAVGLGCADVCCISATRLDKTDETEKTVYAGGLLLKACLLRMRRLQRELSQPRLLRLPVCSGGLAALSLSSTTVADISVHAESPWLLLWVMRCCKILQRDSCGLGVFFFCMLVCHDNSILVLRGATSNPAFSSISTRYCSFCCQYHTQHFTFPALYFQSGYPGSAS